MELDLVIAMLSGCCWQGYSDSELGVLVIDDAGCTTMMIVLWIQYENVWNVVPGRS